MIVKSAEKPVGTFCFLWRTFEKLGEDPHFSVIIEDYDKKPHHEANLILNQDFQEAVQAIDEDQEKSEYVKVAYISSNLENIISWNQTCRVRSIVSTYKLVYRAAEFLVTDLKGKIEKIKGGTLDPIDES